LGGGVCLEECSGSASAGFGTCCTPGSACGSLALGFLGTGSVNACCVPGQGYPGGLLGSVTCNAIAGAKYLCNTDSDCPAGFGLSKCDNGGAGLGECVACLTKADCGAGNTCVGGVCQGCANDNDCTGTGKPYCLSTTCVECTRNSDCPGSKPFCSGNTCSATNTPKKLTCDDCTANSECPSGTYCSYSSSPSSGGIKRCRPVCEEFNDADCTGYKANLGSANGSPISCGSYSNPSIGTTCSCG
jgi:hypothetical protein